MSKSGTAPENSIIAYVRCSTAEQADTGASLDAQRATIAAEAARRGWTVVAEYGDEGVSGGKNLDGRPGLAAAVAAIESGQAAVLVAAKLDRISRSSLCTAELLERSGRKGWKLTTCDMQVDTTSPAGEAMVTVMAAFAQLERRLIGQRTREGLAVKRAQGVRLGRPSSLPAEVVARIVSDRASGLSYGRIADRLNVEGVATGQGGSKWYPATVRKVLEGQDAAKLAA